MSATETVVIIDDHLQATALELETITALASALRLLESHYDTASVRSLRCLAIAAMTPDGSMADLTVAAGCPRPTVNSIIMNWVELGHLRKNSHGEYKVTDHGMELLLGIVRNLLTPADRRFGDTKDAALEIISTREEAAHQTGYDAGMRAGYDLAVADMLAAANANRQART